MEQPIDNNAASNGQIAPTPVQTAPTVSGKSGDPFKVWAIVFALLFLAAAGFAAWQTLQLNEKAAKVTNLESSVADLQAEVATLGGGDQDIAVDGDTPVDSETDAILAAVDAATRAPEAASGQTFEYAIAENANGFARVSVTAAGEAGGYAVILKKVGENWTVVSVGQDVPTQETIDKYAIPEEILN